MGRRYRKPPLEQFVCEFRFEPGSPWDLTIPGLIYERLQGDFPKRKQEARYESRLKKAKQGLEHEVTKSEQIKLLNESENAFVQIGQNLIAVVHLRPYPGWEEFLPMINRGLEVYKEVARPVGINRIGLRCVNLVRIPDSKVELEQYFDFYPHLGKRLPNEIGTFLSGVEFGFNEGRDILRLQIQTAVSENPQAETDILLDLDYFLGISGSIGFEDMDKWLSIAHGRVEDAFEGSITGKARELFEEEV